MSNIDDLKIKVKSLKDKLDAAEDALHYAMIEAHPIKVGTIGLHGPDTVIVSKLVIRYDRVREYGRKKTKAGWSGAERELHRGFAPLNHKREEEG